MFPGFKGVPQLKQGNSGNNLLLPYGNLQSGSVESLNALGQNNFVAGSGMGIGVSNLPPSKYNSGWNNILVGCAQEGDPLSTYEYANIVLTGSDNLLLMPSSAAFGGNGTTTISGGTNYASGIVVLGNPGGYTFGPGSVSIGYANASATNAISIGASSTASATNTISIGNSSIASVSNAIAIGNGASNTTGAGVAIGQSATATAANAIAIGPGAHATGSASILIGAGDTGAGGGCTQITSSGMSFSTNAGAYLQHFGYQLNASTPAASIYASTAIGVNSTIDMSNTLSFAAGSFGSVATGNAQLLTTIGRMQTTNATATEIGLAGAGTNAELRSLTPTGFIQLANNTTYMFDCNITAQVSGGTTDAACWKIVFLIRRGAAAANTVLIGTPSGTTTPLFATTGATSGAWAVAVTADTTNGRPAIKVTGAASTTINWVLDARITKVGG